MMDSMTEPTESTGLPGGYTSRSDRAGVVAVMVLVVGVILGVALGFGVGAGSDGDGGAVMVTSGNEFNWLLAMVAVAPFVVAAVVAWAAGWVLAQLESMRA